MNNLENLAKIRFEQYSLKETGKQYNWYYLPHKRQLAWMQEVLDIYQYVIEDMKSRIKLDPIPGRMNTTYALGRAEGINAERMRFKQELVNMYNNLQDELEDFGDLHRLVLQNKQKMENNNG